MKFRYYLYISPYLCHFILSLSELHYYYHSEDIQLQHNKVIETSTDRQECPFNLKKTTQLSAPLPTNPLGIKKGVTCDTQTHSIQQTEKGSELSEVRSSVGGEMLKKKLRPRDNNKGARGGGRGVRARAPPGANDSAPRRLLNETRDPNVVVGRSHCHLFYYERQEREREK